MCSKKTAVALCLLLLVALSAVWFIGRPAYRRHKETRAVQQAKEFIAKGDYRSASLSARQALLANPHNLDACRMMAELAEMAQSTNALEWLRRIADTAPTTENKLRLAAAALRFQPPPFSLTSNLLHELSATASNLPTFHLLSAERALKLKNVPAALAHFQCASRLEPSNELHHLNLAVLNLTATNPAIAAAARANLERLRSHTNLSTVALRWLIAECLRQGERQTAQTHSEQLVADPRALFDDHMQHLAILHGLNSPDLQPRLQLTQARAATNAVELYALSAWMISRSQAAAALHWIKSCPSQTLARQPAPMALVDCYVALQDWPGLETCLLDQKWDHLEFMRWAFLSRAAAEQNQPQAADVRWRSAIQETGDRLGSLISLMSMASAWNREKAQEDLLWKIATRFPGERWALRDLNRLYSAAGNTLGLNKVYDKAMSYDPKDRFARNNFAATSLLLNLNRTRAHQTAKELYSQFPDEAVIASTYAYSLHLQSRTDEALTTMQRLPPEALQQPAVALYYGLLLSATGNTNQAAPFLSRATNATLLPEEKTLLAKIGR